MSAALGEHICVSALNRTKMFRVKHFLEQNLRNLYPVAGNASEGAYEKSCPNRLRFRGPNGGKRCPVIRGRRLPDLLQGDSEFLPGAMLRSPGAGTVHLRVQSLGVQGELQPH
ncbi:hypothetical protein CU048_11695 [Beijerinckiaceae bacterium]|nr:hypothetical protein CU048_11695 [Beijerinckiaceae bacterium]